ncbi:MAG: hypothetical protein NT025_01320 [bacterium]|nr:hypothetical protein [bacterium]
MKLIDGFWRMLWHTDDLKSQLFAFLGSDSPEFPMLGGRKLSHRQVRDLLQELIPATIEVRGVCSRPVAVVAAAPHVSFDNWSEYFCNRVARRSRIGWVIAKNFRDQHSQTIPISIGRHIHVNRPTESDGPGQTERETERARNVHQRYLSALAEASGRTALPIDLLFEFHSHHRTPDLEIATAGLTVNLARELAEVYARRRVKRPLLPELKIAPLHALRLTADGARREGSIRTEVARVALHVEVPREARQSDNARRTMCAALVMMSETLIRLLPAA